jgi:hypothetical protein
LAVLRHVEPVGLEVIIRVLDGLQNMDTSPSRHRR